MTDGVDADGRDPVLRQRLGDTEAILFDVVVAMPENRHRPPVRGLGASWPIRVWQEEVEGDRVRALHDRVPGASAYWRDVFSGGANRSLCWGRVDLVIRRLVTPEGDLPHRGRSSIRAVQQREVEVPGCCRLGHQG